MVSEYEEPGREILITSKRTGTMTHVALDSDRTLCGITTGGEDADWITERSRENQVKCKRCKRLLEMGYD